MSNSSPLSEQEKSYFIEQFQNIEEEWNYGNRVPYIEFHKDATYMVPHLETLTGPDVIRDFVKAFPEMKAKYNILDIWGNSEVVNVHGKFQGTGLDNELLDKGKFLASFRRDQEGSWKMTHTIWNSDLPLPE
jgi:ketosteroid isomerase-like protein